MTPYERGFLLLCSHLGQPSRAPLSPAQLRRLSVRVRQHSPIHDPREMTPADLRALGYSQHDADHILSLLEDTPLLERYLSNADDMGYGVLTRVSPGYPGLLRMRLGTDAPPCLWYSGDPDILAQPGIGLVGSRDLLPRNAAFARSAGVQIHRQGFTLISGGARGADRTAQDACLDTGGKVVCVLPDRLADHPQNPDILYLCEDSFDLPFQTPRALSRNRVIHALGQCTLVAQCTLGQGGTWDGSTQNLRHSWSPLCCFDDGSDAAKALQDRGARLIRTEDLSDLKDLSTPEPSFF